MEIRGDEKESQEFEWEGLLASRDRRRMERNGVSRCYKIGQSLGVGCPKGHCNSQIAFSSFCRRMLPDHGSWSYISTRYRLCVCLCVFWSKNKIRLEGRRHKIRRLYLNMLKLWISEGNVYVAFYSLYNRSIQFRQRLEFNLTLQWEKLAPGVLSEFQTLISGNWVCVRSSDFEYHILLCTSHPLSC